MKQERMGAIGGELWWWAAAAAQLAAGVTAYRRGAGGWPTLMPFKALAVASLFVGAGATGVAGTLHAHGVRTMDDLKEMGASVRRGLGLPPRETA